MKSLTPAEDEEKRFNAQLLVVSMAFTFFMGSFRREHQQQTLTVWLCLVSWLFKKRGLCELNVASKLET